MNRDVYIGHQTQLYGVEEHRLIGGKGDGMKLLQVKNGLGLEFTVSADRCADISRLSFKGDNYGYFSGTGYVAPAYYNASKDGFLDSFTGGFLTTCGLTNIGVPCSDEKEEFPMHGTIGNTPASSIYYTIEEEAIIIKAIMYDARLFGRRLKLEREIICSLTKNSICLRDKVMNQGVKEEAVCILYHMNMGYPLLSENAQLHIPSKEVIPRNEKAKEELHTWEQILPPQESFEEQCYFHKFQDEGIAAIYNEDIRKGIKISFDLENLNTFTQWKMFGHRDYVLGLEPGNASVDGRISMKAKNTLQYICANEEKSFEINLEVIDGNNQWQAIRQ